MTSHVSETIANDFPGLLDAAHGGQVRSSQALTEQVDENAAGQTRDDGAALSRIEMGSKMSAIHNHSYGWALACCRWDKETAEDVLHTTYVKVLDGRARFRGDASFRTWLFAVIRMTAREMRRSKWRRSLIWQKYAPSTESTSAPTQGEVGDAERLRTELAGLPERQRETLHLVFYGELSISEAAEVMGVSLGTARTHYERGKKKLRVRLGVEVGK